MHFTLFSMVLILAVGASIFVEVRRGLGLGFLRSAVGLAALLFSALCAIGLAVWLSDIPAHMLSEILVVLIPTLETLADAFPHVEDILVAAVDVLLTPILFVCLFPILRCILRCITSALFRTRWKYAPDDPRYGSTDARPDAPKTPNYEPADAPWHRRHDRLLGGITGGVCGFLASIMLLSPLLGILSTTGILLNNLKEMEVSMEQIGVTADMTESAEPYVFDGAAAVLNAMGGDLVFDAVSVTTLNDRTVTLQKELETCLAVSRDFTETIKILQKPDRLNKKKKETVRGLGDSINSSEVTRLLAADFLNGAAASWSRGKSYLGVPCPSFGKALDPLLEEALLVCMETTPECAGRDITTILNVYLIAQEHGLTDNPDREQLMAALEDGGVLDLIYAELKKNPCMTHLCDELSNTALRIMASAIDWADFSSEVYNDLMGNLSEAMNVVNGMEGATFTEQVNSMTRYAMHYAQQYGFELPEAMAEMAATAMVEQLSGAGELDAEAMNAFFSYYLDNGN